MTKISTPSNNHCKLFKKQKKNVNNNKAKKLLPTLGHLLQPQEEHSFLCVLLFCLICPKGHKARLFSLLHGATGHLNRFHYKSHFSDIQLTFSSWLLLTWQKICVNLPRNKLHVVERGKKFRWKQHQSHLWHDHFHMF